MNMFFASDIHLINPIDLASSAMKRRPVYTNSLTLLEDTEEEEWKIESYEHIKGREKERK